MITVTTTTNNATPEVGAPAAAVVQRFLHALARRDYPAVAATLAADVWMRAMLVREILVGHDAETTIAALRAWFATAEDFQVCELEQAGVEGRQRVRWQFVLRPDWAPDTPHRIEQVGYATVRMGRITRLDTVCTGFHPIP